MVQQNVAGRPVSVFRFPPRTTLKALSHATVSIRLTTIFGFSFKSQRCSMPQNRGQTSPPKQKNTLCTRYVGITSNKLSSKIKQSQQRINE